MKYPIHLLRRLQTRFQRSRPGSVLILVIALLVLLALMGTAYISSTRVERFASVQNAVNTQIDLIAQSVESLIEGAVVGKLYDSNGNFRNPASTNNYDSPAGDLYLASRVPEVPPTGLAPANWPTVSGGYMPMWPSISFPLFTASSIVGLPRYEIDDIATGKKAVLIWNYNAGAATATTYTKGDIVAVIGQSPTIYYTPKTTATDDPSNSGTTDWAVVDPKRVFSFIPNVTTAGAAGFLIYNNLYQEFIVPSLLPAVGVGGYSAIPFPAGSNSKQNVITAGDSDGDGIADGPLFKLPIGQLDGVTYYASTRIIDNNSAVNASIANSNVSDVANTTAFSTVASTTNFLGLFRANVGLQQVLNPSTAVTDINALNNYRFNNNTFSTSFGFIPFYSKTASRGDFQYLTEGDAIENILASRLGNPGFLGYAGGTAVQCQSLGNSVTIALAHRFCIPSQSEAVSPSEIETLLPTDTVPTWLANVSVYSPSNVGTSGTPTTVTTSQKGTWFGDNFDYLSNNATATAYQQAYAPVRAVLVGSNAVSNAAPDSAPLSATNASPVHYIGRGAWTTGTNYHFGDWVTGSTAANPGYKYSFVCVQDNTSSAINDPSTITPLFSWTQQAVGFTHPTANNFWEFVPWTSSPVKTSVNTATFGQLWAAYWNVMWDHAYPATGGAYTGFAQPAFGYPQSSSDTNNNQQANLDVPYNSTNPSPARMFRSPIRDPNYATVAYPVAAAVAANIQYLTPGQAMILRSALAAVNTISLRQATGTQSASNGYGLDTVISRQVSIPADVADANSKAYTATVFGATKQPYISEVYVEIGTTNTMTALAVELSNPYRTPMVLNNWEFGWLNRTAATYSTAATPIMVFSNGGTGLPIPLGTIIPAATAIGPGKLIITDLNPAAPTVWPASTLSTSPLSTASVTVLPLTGLIAAAGGTAQELVLVRPRAASGQPSVSIDPVNVYNEGIASQLVLSELAPVDQIDFTPPTAAAFLPPHAYDYRRGTLTSGCSWNFVYPGPYVLNSTIYPFRHTGLASVGNGAFALGQDKTPYAPTAGTPPVPGPVPTATFQTFPMQIANTDSAGFNQLVTGVNGFPFGGFARNGDLLQVPFVSAYRLLQNTAVIPTTTLTPIVEFNSLPMDAALADDEDPTDDYTTAELASATTPPQNMREQIGRFCPVRDVADYQNVDTIPAPSSALNPAPADDFLPPVPNTTTKVNTSNLSWRYHWATHLLDYLTVQSPADDYFPNTDPTNYRNVDIGATADPLGVSNKINTNAQLPSVSEDTIGVEGLININTASWRVLATLPFLPPNSSGVTDYFTVSLTAGTATNAADSIDDNAQIAQAIVNYRNTYGPFKSIFDLYKVPVFKAVNDALISNGSTLTSSGDPGITAGDYSPMINGTTDTVRYDFEERFLLLNRISNLITTRSDSFTCYLLVQGYRNASSSSPVLVAQRRLAFILDRSAATPTSKTFSTVPVPQN